MSWLNDEFSAKSPGARHCQTSECLSSDRRSRYAISPTMMTASQRDRSGVRESLLAAFSGDPGGPGQTAQRWLAMQC